MMRLAFLFLTCFLFTSAASAQAPIATASLISSIESVTPGQPFWLALRLRPQEGWHTYWQNPGDSGVATSLAWEETQGAEIGPIHWPAPDRLPYADLVNFGYLGEVILPVPVTVKEADTGPYRFRAHASWLVCHEVCIPESAELEITLPAGKAKASQDADSIETALARVPQPVAEPMPYLHHGTHFSFSLPTETLPFQPQRAELFTLESGIFPNTAIPAMVRQEKATDFEITRMPEAEGDFNAVLSLFAADGRRANYQFAFHQSSAAPQPLPDAGIQADADAFKFPTILLLAFLGGLILNVMPCVLPVLALKALTLARKAESDPADIRRQGIAYTAGILICFLSLAVVLLLLQQGGVALGWGFQLQSPVFVTILAGIMLAVGLSLAGAFHLPALLGGVEIRDTSLQGSFLTGLLAGLVATPCTAPFMAAAVGYALTESPLVALGIFAVMGLGLAFPFLLFSFLPRTARLLPKPGAWMHHLKHFFGFLMCASAAWLIWVLALQTDSAGLALTLFAMLLFAFALCAAYLPLPVRLLLLILSLLPLYGVHPAPAAPTSTDFSVQKIESLRAEGRGVFVDATAAWCLTCKVNERTTLDRPEIRQAMKDKNIAYLVADWTKGDPEITRWLASFERRGVPLYVYYPAQSEPVILPQILSPGLVLKAIEGR